MTHFCLSGAGTESFPWQIESPNSVLPQAKKINFLALHTLQIYTENGAGEPEVPKRVFLPTNKPRTKVLLGTKRKSISYLQPVSSTFPPRTQLLLQALDLPWETLQGRGKDQPQVQKPTVCSRSKQSSLCPGSVTWTSYSGSTLGNRRDSMSAQEPQDTRHRTPRRYLKATEVEGSSRTSLSFQW